MKYRYTGNASDAQVRWGGNDDPRELLVQGECYEVERAEVRSWHTKYHIEVDGEMRKFNSVHFERAAEGESDAD